MSDNNSLTVNVAENALVLHAFGKSPELVLQMSSIRLAEQRYLEAKTVSPSSYADLEHCFNESYRDIKRHLSNIGYQLALADKAMEEAKATVLLDKYPDFIKDKPKTQDNADLRKAFLMRDEAYCLTLDRIAQLKALESNFDGKLKVVENVCRYMRKKMDLIIRSGLSGADIYNTQGRK